MPVYKSTTNNNSKGNIKLFDYQQEAKNKTGVKTTICNWSRGIGKTYTLSSIILDERPQNVLYVGNTSNSMKSLVDKFNEIFELHPKSIKGVIQDLKITQEKIIIQYFDGVQTTIYDYGFMPRGSNQEIQFDYIMFNDLLPTPIDYRCKRVISMVTVNNFNKRLEQLYKHNTVVLNEDYSAGVRNNIFTLNRIEKYKTSNNWYDDYAILNDPNNALKDIDKPNEFTIRDTLYDEIKCLVPKIQKARENEEYGTYKNLILAYKEVLLLINDMYKQYGFENKKANMYVNYIALPEKQNNKVEVLVKNKQYIISGPVFKKAEDFINPIKQIAKNENAIIYIDTHGCGIALYDLLSEVDGLIVNEVNLDKSFRLNNFNMPY